MKKTIILIVLFLSVLPSHGQKYWTLEECIDYALQNNIAYKRSRLVVEISSNNLWDGRMDVFPRVNAFANTAYNWGTTFSFDQLAYVDENKLDGNFGVEVSMDLFNGLENLNKMASDKYQVYSDMENAESRKKDITLQVVAAYLQVLLDQELVSLAEDQLGITHQQVERMESLVEVGNEPKGKLLELRAQEAQEKSNLTAARTSLDIGYLLLVQLMQIENADSLRVMVPADAELSEGTLLNRPEDIYERARAIMPEVRSAEYYLKSQEKNLASLRGRYYPNLSARLLVYTRFDELAQHPTWLDGDPGNDVADYSYHEQFKDFRYTMFGVRLGIPIFNQFDTRTQVSNQKISVMDARLALKDEELRLRESIQRAHAQALGALENYRSNLETVKSQQEAFDYAEQRFLVGLISSVDYNLAKTNLTEARSNLLQSRFQYIFRSSILDYYLGNEIEL